jgi:SAM-dependent methyltransferase
MFVSRPDWHGDQFTLGGFEFRLQTENVGTTADDAFLFYKNREMVEQFERFFSEAGFHPATMLELGIWDGGSAAFWVETLKLIRYVGIDLQTRGDSRYYLSWLHQRGAGIAITKWGVNQTDGPALDKIISECQLEPLDLILDDCSHQYAPTLQSLELLFNHLRPGGYYIIEDWAWALRPEFQQRENSWSVLPALHPVIHRILDLHGSRPDLIASIKVFPAFAAIERGPATVQPFSVRKLTARRERPWSKVVTKRARRIAGSARRRMRNFE